MEREGTMKIRVISISIVSAFILGACAVGGNIKFGEGGSLPSGADKPLVVDISKYYVPSASATPSGVVTWTLTFSKALVIAPVMTVSDTALADVAVNPSIVGEVNCSLGEDPSIVTCTYESVATCRELKDYFGVVSGGSGSDGAVMDDVNLHFNAADDEFDVANSIDNCWEIGGSKVATYTIADSELQIDVFAWPPDTEMQLANINKTPFTTDFAIIIDISDLTPPDALPLDTFVAAGLGTSAGGPGGGLEKGYNILLNGFAGTGGLQPSEFLGAIVTRTDDANFTFYAADTSWGADMSQYKYLCEVRYGGVRSVYASADGKSFSHFASNNTTLMDAADPLDPTPLDYDFVGFETYPLSVQIFTYNPGLIPEFSPKYDFARFRSSGITGTADDCVVSLMP